MDYGSQLGNFPEELMIDSNKINGCQSTVYIAGEKKNEQVFYKGFADSKLVQGQVAILLKIFNGQKADDIINNSKNELDNFVNATKIIPSLTPSRQNVFGSMYEHIKKLAQ
jgi:cysteine desulfuration protein SufE